MGWPKGKTREAKEISEPTVKESIRTENPRGTSPEEGLKKKTSCEQCGHPKSIHYGSKLNQCNTRDCVCEQLA